MGSGLNRGSVERVTIGDTLYVKSEFEFRRESRPSAATRGKAAV